MTKPTPTLEYIRGLLFLSPTEAETEIEALLKQSNAHEATSSTSTEKPEHQEASHELTSRYLAAKAAMKEKYRNVPKPVQFNTQEAKPGDVVLLEGRQSFGTPVAVVLDTQLTETKNMWMAWLTSPYVEYATAYDLLFDQRNDTPPAAGMVMAWCHSKVYLSEITTRLAQVTMTEVAQLRALHDEFLAQPELPYMATPGERKTLGGIIVRTGTPLTDPLDERAGFAQLYSLCAGELTTAAVAVEAEELVRSGAEQPLSPPVLGFFEQFAQFVRVALNKRFIQFATAATVVLTVGIMMRTILYQEPIQNEAEVMRGTGERQLVLASDPEGRLKQLTTELGQLSLKYQVERKEGKIILKIQSVDPMKEDVASFLERNYIKSPVGNDVELDIRPMPKP